MTEQVDTEKRIAFYKRKEFWGMVGNVLAFTPDILNATVNAGIIPEYTLIAKLILPFSLLLTALGVKKGYKAENLVFQKNTSSNLPEGLRRNPFKKKEDFIGE